MNIVILSPECFPYTSSTGLSDFVYTLARNIEKEKNNVKIFLPRYGSIDPEEFFIERMPNEFQINLEAEQTQAIVYKGILKDSLVSTFLIDNQNHFSNSKEVYLTGTLDFERFKFFSFSVISLLRQLNFAPDIIHLFNPQTTIFNDLNKKLNYKQFAETPTVFTIYNSFNFQEEFLKYTKAAIDESAFVTTISSSYAGELLLESPISDNLSKKDLNFASILLGTDYDLHNPESDPDLKQNYSINYFSTGKKKCKEELLSILKLDENNHYPLISIVCNLNDEDGTNFLLSVLPQVLSMEVNILILAKGNSDCEKQFMELSEKFNNLRFYMDYNFIFVKKLYSSADFYLSTFKGENIAMNLLTAMRYGCVPIAFNSSAVKDIVLNWGDCKNSNGITYPALNKEQFLETILKAIDLYRNKKEWTRIVKEVMSYDSNSRNAARKYMTCFENLLCKTQSV